MIVDPVTMRPEQSIREALEVMKRFKISGLPVTDQNGRLVGILTNRDLRFESNLDRPISELMTKEHLVTRGARHHPRAGQGAARTSTASRSCWWSTTAPSRA